MTLTFASAKPTFQKVCYNEAAVCLKRFSGSFRTKRLATREALIVFYARIENSVTTSFQTVLPLALYAIRK